MTAWLPLSQGVVTLVDDDDFELANQFKWSLMCTGAAKTPYAARNVSRPDGGRTTLYLHTFLTDWGRVDHRDCNGLNNRRDNLREATPRQNMGNRRKLAQASSVYKGVCLRPGRRNPWLAAIGMPNGKKLHLGHFATEYEAALAYDAAAVVQFGEFARLNFPEVTHAEHQ